MEFVIHWHGIHVLIYDFPKVAKNDESVISRQEEAVSNEMGSVQLKKLKLISVSKTENSSVDKDEEQIIDIPLLYDKISIKSTCSLAQMSKALTWNNFKVKYLILLCLVLSSNCNEW